MVRLGLSLFWCCCVVLVASSALASRPDADCILKFRQKKYEQAGVCFHTLSNKTPLSSRKKKGRWLRNAAVAFNKAAKRQDSLKTARASLLAGWYREKAVQWLEKYLVKKLCSSPRRCKSGLSLQSQLQKKIGYATVTLVLHHPKATCSVKGFRYSLTKTGDQTLRLRPGSYLLHVTYPPAAGKGAATPSKPVVVTRKLIVKPGKNSIQTFKSPNVKVKLTPPKKTPGTINLFVVGLAGGGGLVLIGGGMLVAGGSLWSTANEAWLDPEKTAQEALSGKGLGEALMIIGSIALVGGAACMVVGPILHARNTRNVNPKTASLPRPGTRILNTSRTFVSSLRVTLP